MSYKYEQWLDSPVAHGVPTRTWANKLSWMIVLSGGGGGAPGRGSLALRPRGRPRGRPRAALAAPANDSRLINKQY